eukprot:1340825-Amorphochlora_amoeboformis.AAC.1
MAIAIPAGRSGIGVAPGVKIRGGMFYPPPVGNLGIKSGCEYQWGCAIPRGVGFVWSVRIANRSKDVTHVIDIVIQVAWIIMSSIMPDVMTVKPIMVMPRSGVELNGAGFVIQFRFGSMVWNFSGRHIWNMCLLMRAPMRGRGGGHSMGGCEVMRFQVEGDENGTCLSIGHQLIS